MQYTYFSHTMSKKALFSIVMSLTLVFCASATEKIVRFDTSTHKIAPKSDHNWKSTKFVRAIDSEATSTSDVTLGPAEGYSILSGPDGTQWYSTQTYTEENYYYTASTITLYNSKGEQQGVLNITIPEGENVNQIMVGDLVSTSLFDKDANTMEVPVITHTIHSPGNASYTSHIYDIASGTIKYSYDGRMVVVGYNNGYRNEWLGVLSGDSIVDGKASVRYDIYTKPGYGSERATLKKTFTVPNVLAEYQVGSVLNMFIVDNKPYYVVSSYEKEYLDPVSYEEPWDMIPTADNHFVATIYDQNFKEQNTIKIPVTSTQQRLVQYGIGLFGFQDLSHNYWDESGDMHLVVTSTGFNVTSGEEDIRFDVYDMEGNVVKTIAEDAGDWMKMYDVPGQPTQMAILSADGGKMKMVDLPACQTVIEFGNEVEGEAISTNIDRYTVGAGYQYLVALPSPEVDAEKNFIQRFAWITTEGEIANQVKFNLGKNNASWIPLVMGEVLNPYVFDTDDQREYVFIANQYASGTSGKMYDELHIVKEDGTLVRAYKEDGTNGEIGTCNVLGFEEGCPSIIVPFLNSATDKCTVIIDHLPFNKFSAGGDGSAETPYLISSIGDMALISRDRAANYKVVKDFDAAALGPWQPTELFTGTFDGGNHTISNLYIESDSYYPAIFGETENAIIKDLRLQSPQVYGSRIASTVGVVAASAVATTISNVHVFDAEIYVDAEATATVGGIVGSASLSSSISECYQSNLIIDAPGAAPVGGIAGDTRTTSGVNACAVSGTIIGKSSVGGIVGDASTACAVTNCHSIADITGKNIVGGVAGSADRGGIHACIAEGSLSATQPGYNGYIRVGGIAGSLTASYEESSTNEDETPMPWDGKVISNNVVNITSLNAEGKAVHRIIGYSRWDEDTEAKKSDSTVEITMDAGIAKNYAVNPQDAVDADIAAEPTTTEGATLAEGEYNAEFLASIDFAFGESADAPWTATGDNSFALYFEETDKSGIHEIEADDNAIIFTGSAISSGITTKVELFNLSGVKVAAGTGSISTVSIAKGIYIVKATDASGNGRAEKIAIK